MTNKNDLIFMARRTSCRFLGSFISTSSFMKFSWRTAKRLNFFSVNLKNKNIQISHKKESSVQFSSVLLETERYYFRFSNLQNASQIFFYILRFINVEDTKCTKNEADRFINKSMVILLPVFGFCLKYTQFVLVFCGFFL